MNSIDAELRFVRQNFGEFVNGLFGVIGFSGLSTTEGSVKFDESCNSYRQNLIQGSHFW